MAGQIPQHFIDDLLAKIDIVDVIDRRVSLKKKGNNFAACCPFHNEKTPSFSVSQTKQFYHCFGCGESGNAITFLMLYDGMHFVDAIESLADSVGLEVPRTQSAQNNRNDSKPLYQLMEAVSQFYIEQLKHSEAAINYLKSRGLDGVTAKKYAIGFAPDGWDALQQQFPESTKALLATGMLTSGEAGKRPYQRFRNRIMFPIRDRRGRVIAFGGRVIGQGEPKYLNSPETTLFQKGSELYGLPEARKSAQDAGFVVVVEGYMDVVVLSQFGVTNAVATLGTAANRQHSEMLFKIVPNIVFCFDGDRAGRAAAWRALTATLPCLNDGYDAQFLFLPDGEDPDSYVRQHGAIGFKDLLNARIPIIDFLYQHLAENIDTKSIGGKAQLASKAQPLLDTVPTGIYKQLALRRLESMLGIALDKGSVSPGLSTKPQQTAKKDSGLTTMSRAILLCLQYPVIVQSVPVDDIDVNTELPGAELLIRIISYCDSAPEISTARLLERFRDSDSFKHLNKLAVKPYYPDGRELTEEAALEEFRYCMIRLKEKSQKTMSDKVAPAERKGLLGIVRR